MARTFTRRLNRQQLRYLPNPLADYPSQVSEEESTDQKIQVATEVVDEIVAAMQNLVGTADAFSKIRLGNIGDDQREAIREALENWWADDARHRARLRRTMLLRLVPELSGGERVAELDTREFAKLIAGMDGDAPYNTVIAKLASTSGKTVAGLIASATGKVFAGAANRFKKAQPQTTPDIPRGVPIAATSKQQTPLPSVSAERKEELRQWFARYGATASSFRTQLRLDKGKLSADDAWYLKSLEEKKGSRARSSITRPLSQLEKLKTQSQSLFSQESESSSEETSPRSQVGPPSNDEFFGPPPPAAGREEEEEEEEEAESTFSIEGPPPSPRRRAGAAPRPQPPSAGGGPATSRVPDDSSGSESGESGGSDDDDDSDPIPTTAQGGVGDSTKWSPDMVGADQDVLNKLLPVSGPRSAAHAARIAGFKDHMLKFRRPQATVRSGDPKVPVLYAPPPDVMDKIKEIMGKEEYRKGFSRQGMPQQFQDVLVYVLTEPAMVGRRTIPQGSVEVYNKGTLVGTFGGSPPLTNYRNAVYYAGTLVGLNLKRGSGATNYKTHKQSRMHSRVLSAAQLHPGYRLLAPSLNEVLHKAMNDIEGEFDTDFMDEADIAGEYIANPRRNSGQIRWIANTRYQATPYGYQVLEGPYSGQHYTVNEHGHGCKMAMLLDLLEQE